MKQPLPGQSDASAILSEVAKQQRDRKLQELLGRSPDLTKKLIFYPNKMVTAKKMGTK